MSQPDASSSNLANCLQRLAPTRDPAHGSNVQDETC